MSAKIYKNSENPVFCDVLVRPLATEKTVRSQELSIYTFQVAAWANKCLVRKAVEFLFDVRVKDVNILNQCGKRKFFRGRQGFRPGISKAYVKLAAGCRIDLASGL